MLGLGPGLFYNSPMEACVIICHRTKRKQSNRKILFIDAVTSVARERAQSFLKSEHQDRILRAYRAFEDEPGFAAVIPIEEVLANGGKLSIPLYVKKPKTVVAPGEETTLAESWAAFDEGGREFWTQMDALVDMLDGVVAGEANDA